MTAALTYELLEAAERGDLFHSCGRYTLLGVEVDAYTAHRLADLVTACLLLVPAHGPVELSGYGEQELAAQR